MSWAAQEARRRREAFDASKLTRYAEMRREREQQPLVVRLEGALARASSLATGPAGTHGGSHVQPASTGTKGPPASQHIDLGKWIGSIRLAVEQIERAVDAETGLFPVSAARHLTSEEKNRMILEVWIGVPSSTVASVAPWLGSARTVERVRTSAGVKPSSGLSP